MRKNFFAFGHVGTVMLTVLLLDSTLAATRTWTGNSPTSGNWTIPANWDGGGNSPSNGDDLVFPSIAGRYLTTNNFSNFRARSITFAFNGDGYQLHGNSITLSNGLTASQLFGSNAVFFDITLGAAQVWSCQSGGLLGVFGDVTNASHTLTVANGGAMTLAGVISGTGGLIKSGDDTLTFAGVFANTYSGMTLVNEGKLAFDKTTGLNALAGNLTLGQLNETNPVTLELRSSTQIPNSTLLTLHNNSLFNLNGFNETVGAMSLYGGDIETGSGTLTLAGDVALTGADSPTTIYGRLSLGAGTRTFNHTNFGSMIIRAEVSGSADWIINGEGTLSLRSTNIFTGDVFLNGPQLYVNYNASLGSPAGATHVNNNGWLIIYPIGSTSLHIGQEPLFLDGTNSLLLANGTNIWDGPVQLTGKPGIFMHPQNSLNFAGPISGSGGLEKDGAGTLIFSGNAANTYPGETHIVDGDFVLTKTNAIAVAGFLNMRGNVIEQLRPHQIADTAVVLVPTGSQWQLNGNDETVGGLASNFASDGGEIAMGSGTLTVQNEGFNFSHFHGPITGTGGFIKRGAGQFELGGDNTYAGATRVEQGGLSIEDDQPLSPVTVLAGAALDGIGTVGHLHAESGATVSPGIFHIPFTYPLTTSNVVMDAGSTLRIRLQNTSNTVLNARGTVTLNNPNLVLHFGEVPKVGDTYTIVQNDGVDAVVGTFAGLPNGQFYGPGGILMEIAYGNDVTVRVISPGITNLPPGVGLTVIGGNGNGVIDPNECDQLRITLFNNGTNPLPAFHATLETTFPGVIVTQPGADFPAIAPQGTGASVSLFQISTPPGLVCGTNLPFVLNIHTASNSAYQIPILLPTGAPGLPVRFDNNTTEAIPDGGSIESLLEVSFTGHVARVEVAMFIEHPLASDLDVTLIAPDGTEVPLAVDLGNSANYGTNCADSGRTFFRDDASAAVTSADAPFIGVFRPLGYLSVFRGRSASEMEGKWKLRVSDDTHFNLGSLRCWSLLISPAVCTDGGGACDHCPGNISGQINLQSPVASGWVYGLSKPSNCFSNQPCPEIVEAPVRYAVHTFTNLSSQPACVSYTLAGECGPGFQVLMGAAYAGAFNPAAPCENFIGASELNNTPVSASFKVPGGAVFQIAVFALNDPYNCDSYSLFVDAPDLCPVPLSISTVAPNQMRLDWPSYAVGFNLQRTEALPTNNWTTLTNAPVITDGRLTVTNQVVNPNGFYRLKKD